MMKKDISANLYQKCLILCSKILLNVLHYLSLTILFPWQHNGFQTSPILKTFLAPFGVQFSYLQMVPDMHDPTSILNMFFVSLWPCITFFELKIANTLKSSGGDWKRVSCHGNKSFCSRRCVSCRTISLPSFNDLRCKLAKIAHFIHMM